MDEHEITQRLRDVGDQPVPGEVRTDHLSRMQSAAPTVERPKRFGRLAVAAAAFVGFAVGSTGFAMAGALPDPAQQVAHDVLAVVQVDVKDPKNRGQCISAAARANPDDEAAKRAAKELCPKGRPDGVGKGRPDHPGKGKGRPDGAGPSDELIDDGDPCKGPPVWAGRGRPSPEEKQAHKDARSACDPDDDDPAEAEALEDQREAEAEALEDQREAEAEASEEQEQPPAAEQAPVDPQEQAPEGAPFGAPPEDVPGKPDAGQVTPEDPAATGEEPVEEDPAAG